MIRGLEMFRKHFAPFPDSYLMIGGVACHEWFQAQGLEFRATKDLDVVIVIEALTQEFVNHFWKFIEAGAYQIRRKSEGGRILYRFSKPEDESFPIMIEVFSRKPDAVTLWESQTIIPIAPEKEAASLSAILMDDAYYQLILSHRVPDSDPSSVSPHALIPLKVRAWLDLSLRKANGETVDSRDIDKHRSDVFRLAATLTGEPGPEIDPKVKTDLKEFLAAFPPEVPDWKNIQASLRPIFQNTVPSSGALLGAITQTLGLGT